ncbi:M1 family metallopeptidase [Kitasatospora sp. NPDC054939]
MVIPLPRPCSSPALALSSVLLCLTALTPPATAAAPVGLGDPVYPALGSPDYDAVSYDLSFTYRPDSRTVDATTVLTARALTELDAVELDAAGLAVHRVEVDGRPARFEEHGEKLRVVPAARVPRGAPLVVSVGYTADPAAAPGRAGWVPTPDGFAVAAQPDGAHRVFPCNDHPSDKARFTVAVTAPDALHGVANGTLTSTDRDAGGLTTRRYGAAEPMATELVQVSVGSYTVRERTGPHGLRLRDVVPVARAEALEPALALTPGQLEWAEQRLGPYPFETYGLMPADTDDPQAFDFTGLETQTLTIYKPNFLLKPESQIGSHMMHELVHSWFGNSVTPAAWADLWLNEGHADYYGLLYRYERGWADSAGFTTMEQRMRDVYAKGDQWRRSSGPVALPTAATLFDTQRYTGGALVLYALRERVGAAAFERIERAFLRLHRHDTASTADFVRIASAESGEDLHGFLTDWLYGERTPAMPGHPDWTVDAVPPAAQVGRGTGSAPRGSGTL